MNRFPRCVSFSTVCFLLSLGLGCSGKPTIATNESVEGTATLDGVPIANVMVQFVPNIDPKHQAPMSSAFTDKDGKYKLACDNKKWGAVVGKHNVLIFAGRTGGGEEEADANAARPRVAIPADYTTTAKTPLKIEVTADKHTYDLPVISTRGPN